MKEKTVYIASDGAEFESEQEALDHESKTSRRKEGGIPVVIYTNPDLTEGRHGPQTPVYGVVYSYLASKSNARNFASLYALSKYGAPVNFVMGVFGGNAIIRNWRVDLVDWNQVPSEVSFVVVDRFRKGDLLYPHKDLFGEKEWDILMKKL